MKKKFLSLLLLLILASYMIIGCKKIPIEPTTCDLLFKIRFLDKNTGQDLGLRGTPFLDSIKIQLFRKSDIREDLIGIQTPIAIMTYDTAFSYDFMTEDHYFDICDEREYSLKNGLEVKYLISYTEDIPSDSIVLWIGKINYKSLINISLNDSLLSTIYRDNIVSSSTSYNMNILK